MITIDPETLSTAKLQAYLQGVVAPRPIAFASTVSTEGKVNLSPFSFFNVFSSNPPILIFSPARRVRDNTLKNTLENVLEHNEVVINIVNFAMVEQMSLASTEYDKGVNEFVKAGFTQVPSVKVRPPRVAESPASFECVVKQVVPLGTEGGAGNLVVCQVVLAHFKDELFDEKGNISPFKADLVSRMGGDWYCRANGEALFELPKPLQTKGIGVDAIPEAIRLSEVLTGNNLGRLGNVETLPTHAQVSEFAQQSAQIATLREQYSEGTPAYKKAKHLLAQQLLAQNKVQEAWLVLLCN